MRADQVITFFCYFVRNSSECLISKKDATPEVMTEAECEDESVEETTYLAKLMAYCSREAHSCVEKAAMIGFVKVKTHTLPEK